MVVLTDEHDRCPVGRGEDHGLVDVTLACRAITEVRHSDLVGAIVEDAEPVADRMKGLRADDDLERRHPDGFGVVGCTFLAAPHAHIITWLSATGIHHAMLSVAREDEVLRGQCSTGADLCRLLPVARRPQAKLALALQGDTLGINATQDDHVLVQSQQGSRVNVRKMRIKFGVR